MILEDDYIVYKYNYGDCLSWLLEKLTPKNRNIGVIGWVDNTLGPK